MMNDYGKKGLIGVLTPQANTTVEPEFWTLLPTGWSLINTRLTSKKKTIESRLVDYTKNFGKTAEQFANAPANIIASACTGASYLIGQKAELEIKSEMENRYKVPFLTAALATVNALRDLDVKNISLLSPYPDTLTKLQLIIGKVTILKLFQYQAQNLRLRSFTQFTLWLVAVFYKLIGSYLILPQMLLL